MDISKELARMSEENRMKNQKEEVIIEEESEYAIEELGEEIYEDGVYEEEAES